MNREYLEQLLIDQALDELPPETAALLDAYLSDHPEQQPLVDSIQETVQLGKKAVHAELPTRLPTLRKDKLIQCDQKVSWLSTSRWLSVAASLIIGFSLGISAILLQDTPLPTYSDPAVSSFQPQPVEGGFEAARAFWSSKTYIDRYQKRSKEPVIREKDTELQKQIQKFKKRGLL
ncbi:MAG: anti-sigma factor family protein [Planctomycetota bacterium]|jgi:anti-sigma factor RsiW